MDTLFPDTPLFRPVGQNLWHAGQRISMERGNDPGGFVLVACGGAGPMHGAAIGRLLGCAKVYLPRLSGAFCALGMLHSDVRHDLVRVLFAPLDAVDPHVVDRSFAEMERSEEHTSELQSLMRTSYAVFCLKKKNKT